MHLNSQNGSINVLLVNHDTKSDTPVVVQVPPPEDGAPPVPMNTLPAPSKMSTNPEIKGPVIKEEVMEERLSSKIASLFILSYYSNLKILFVRCKLGLNARCWICDER